MNNNQINMDEFYEHMKEGRVVEPDSVTAFAFRSRNTKKVAVTRMSRR